MHCAWTSTQAEECAPSPRDHTPETIAALLAACAAGTAAVVALAPAASASGDHLPTPLRPSASTPRPPIWPITDLVMCSLRGLCRRRQAFSTPTEVQLKFRSTNSEGQPHCCADHGALTSRRRAGSVVVVVSPASSMLWGSAVRRQPRCTPTTFKLAIREAPGLNVAIAKGWSVAIPDHLGPPRAYGAAKLGGQITLDGYPHRQAIRRARSRREPRWDGRLLRRRNGDGNGRGDRPDLRSKNSSSRAAPTAALR